MSEPCTAERAGTLTSRLRHHPLLTLRDEMDDLFSRFLGAEEGMFTSRMMLPMDLSETDSALEVVLDLPGVDPDTVDIRITGSVLHVRGERKERSEERGRTYHRGERRRGPISRDIALCCPVEESEVAAEYRNGVLTITLPKSEEAKTRKIAVKH